MSYVISVLAGNPAPTDTTRMDTVTDATLEMFRALADAMTAGTPQTWQWIGPHISQRMFGMSRERAETYAAKFGGVASPMRED